HPLEQHAAHQVPTVGHIDNNTMWPSRKHAIMTCVHPPPTNARMTKERNIKPPWHDAGGMHTCLGQPSSSPTDPPRVTHTMYRYTTKQAQNKNTNQATAPPAVSPFTARAGLRLLLLFLSTSHTAHATAPRREGDNRRRDCTNERTCLPHHGQNVPQRISHAGKELADTRDRFAHVYVRSYFFHFGRHAGQGYPAAQALHGPAAAAPHPWFRPRRSESVRHGLCRPGVRGRRRPWGSDMAGAGVRCRRCR
ncbi:unnamed protein product, partial [Ectocarpus sp. 12 AP-2014]